ncbi:MAG: PAS domain S-box protein [gamma proteobacterium endosymbiont of Lamellibrachia anaximandri]|nr:PAS domain S-box protein [gamma proteobacterium endosymbiont of Lamellibrachia anaximandri]MBL3534938.1 PAS domain S-box protein [gamma proteobacterium endosymbiont of Lamellibrachia anaximandri]
MSKKTGKSPEDTNNRSIASYGNDLLRAVIDQLPDVFVLKDAKGNFLLCNHTVAKLYNTTPEQMIGKHDGDFGVPKEMADFFRENVLSIMASGISETVYEDSRDAITGEIRHFRSIKTPIKDPKGTNQIIVTAQDITDLVEARDKAEKSETRLRYVLEATGEGIWDWDVTSNKVTNNVSWCRMFGFPEDEIEHQIDDFAGLLFEEDKPEVMQALNDCLSGKTDSYYHEHRMKRLDGEVIWVLDRGQVVERGNDGQPLRMVGSASNITNRKQTEFALQETKEEAEAANRSKSEFLANMSHEIRTPLSAVLGIANIGQKEAKNSESRNHFQQILQSGEHLLRVINDILDFSKIEAGKLSLEETPFSFVPTIEEAVNMMADRAQNKSLSLMVEFGECMPAWVIGDAFRLRQILLNLLSNAVKFTDQGSIMVTVNWTDGVAEIAVKDTGVGMNEAQISRLFSPFEQGDSSTTRKYGGTGLGLNISRSLVKMMKGSLSVNSQLGYGTEFVLRVNLTETETTGSSKQSVTENGNDQSVLTGMRILAAEDVELNQMILEDLLVTEGAEVILAENGQVALDILRERGASAFDLVLMDIQMPVMNGFEATSHIKEMAPDLPVIGLTAHALVEEKQKCLDAGMSQHLTKPIDPDELIRVLAQYATSHT